MKNPHHTLFQRCVHCAKLKFIMEYRTDDPKIFQWSCMHCQVIELNGEWIKTYPKEYQFHDGTTIKQITTKTGPLGYEVIIPRIAHWLIVKNRGEWITLLMVPLFGKKQKV